MIYLARNSLYQQAPQMRVCYAINHFHIVNLGKLQGHIYVSGPQIVTTEPFMHDSESADSTIIING
jgi:hypothetical protein